MSSLPEHGFKINSYMELVVEEVFESITDVLTNAMTWFGSKTKIIDMDLYERLYHICSRH